jgi:hypothetical protein
VLNLRNQVLYGTGTAVAFYRFENSADDLAKQERQTPAAFDVIFAILTAA